MIQEAKFTSSPLEKALEKQIKTIKYQGWKQIHAFKNQDERPAALTNKDYHKYNPRKIFEEIVKERYDEIKELTSEINHNDLIYLFKGNTAKTSLKHILIHTYIFLYILCICLYI